MHLIEEEMNSAANRESRRKLGTVAGVSIAVLVLAIILALVDTKKEEGPKEVRYMTDAEHVAPVVAAAPVAAANKQTEFDAYGMACDFVCRHTGMPHSTKFEMSKDECVDYGTGEFVIVGYASWEGMHKRWTISIKSNADGTWSETAPMAIADVR